MWWQRLFCVNHLFAKSQQGQLNIFVNVYQKGVIWLLHKLVKIFYGNIWQSVAQN